MHKNRYFGKKGVIIKTTLMKKEKKVKQGSILKQQLTILQLVESSPSVL